IAALFLRNVTELSKPSIDIPSIILSSAGFGSFLYGFSIASNEGWTSPLVIGTIGIGAIVIALFVWRQIRLKEPMLEFRVFQFRIFTLAIIITMVVLVSLIGAETLLPLFMQNVLEFTPLKSGLMLLPGAIVIGIMSPITGRLFDRYGGKWLALTGLGIVTITTFLFTTLSLETSFTCLTIVYACDVARWPKAYFLGQHPHIISRDDQFPDDSSETGDAHLLSLGLQHPQAALPSVDEQSSRRYLVSAIQNHLTGAGADVRVDV